MEWRTDSDMQSASGALTGPGPGPLKEAEEVPELPRMCPLATLALLPQAFLMGKLVDLNLNWYVANVI